jgi:regulation of enolase protein 1 (concanavalin A-like superfamily)
MAAALEGPGASDIRVPGMTGPFEWKNAPAGWKATGTELTIISGQESDWYISPIDGKVSAGAPLLLFRPAGDFVLTARVTVDFKTQWDAGFLMVYVDDTTWAKFALEMSAYQEPTVVTVVTRGVSDDCNSTPIAGNSIHLRVVRKGPAIIFYASPDGHAWKLVRAFRLGTSPDLRVGFASQSPVGQTGSATFSEIVYDEATIADIFKGE